MFFSFPSTAHSLPDLPPKNIVVSAIAAVFSPSGQSKLMLVNANIYDTYCQKTLLHWTILKIEDETLAISAGFL